MQKVLLLPMLHGYKACVFTKRVVCFNETFAPIKGWSTQIFKKPLAVVWHEGISGRNDEDVASSIIKCISSCQMRDTKHITLWMGNCAGQNKNWTLISLLVGFVNRPDLSIKTITLKYFTAGHTFMSADSYHKLVEDEIRSNENVEDWADLKNCFDANGTSIEMGIGDFIDCKNELSHSTASLKQKPLLKDVVVAKFQKGSLCWYFKNSHKDRVFQHHEFLKQKVSREIEKSPTAYFSTLPKKYIRGINKAKRDNILKKLGPLLTDNRKTFYKNLMPVEGLSDLHSEDIHDVLDE